MILQKSVKNCIFSVFSHFSSFLENELLPIRAGGATQVACLHTRVDLSITHFIDQSDLIGKSWFSKKSAFCTYIYTCGGGLTPFRGSGQGSQMISSMGGHITYCYPTPYGYTCNITCSLCGQHFKNLYGGPRPQGYPLGLILLRSKRPCFRHAASENTVGLTVRFFSWVSKSNHDFVWGPIHLRRGVRTIDPRPPLGTAILPCPYFPYKLIFLQSGPGGLSRWHVCTRG